MIAQEEMFDALVDLYPNKDNIHYAKKAFKKLKPSYDLFLDICDHIERQMDTEQWTKQGGKFIPQLIKYLEGRRWEDGGIVVPKRKRVCSNCGCNPQSYHRIGNQIFCSVDCRKKVLGW